MQRNGAMVKLSPRETQIARLFFEEDPSNREIAERLGISENTVFVHSQKMFRALEIGSRSQLVLWLAQHPRALFLGEWADWRTHPMGCECLLPYCAYLRDQVLAGIKPIAA